VVSGCQRSAPQLFPILQGVSAPVAFQTAKCGGHSWSYTTIMPQDRYSSKQTFDISILDAGALDSPGGLETALHSLESMCFEADPAIAEMITALSSRSHVLEYIFSGTLCLPATACEFPGQIILLPSAGREGIREVV
jgi:hypothetical protein